MKIFDAHCDVLYQLWKDPTLSFEDSPHLHITYEQLQQTGGKVQCFAIFVPDDVPYGTKFQAALQMVDIFYKKVIEPFAKMKPILTRHDLTALQSDEIGAILTLEGVDAVEGSVLNYETLLRLGVRSVGLTWNYANLAADGVLEERGAGLSSFGKRLVAINNAYNLWTDVSHLCEQAFWDVMETAHKPIATHSNAKALCGHPRNLTDNQIKAMFEHDGRIGVTFVPQFLCDNEQAALTDVLHHLDHLCSLGGEDYVGFGSDFDGIDKTVKGLERYHTYEKLINALLNNYSDSQVEKFLFSNFYNDFLV
ncbi:dipeptidase [Bacillus tianshenii]|nr:dipeptidase [Bacillus tianshenii]